MKNIKEYSFKSILDNYGSRVVEFGFSYDCDNEKKHSTIIIPCDIMQLTEETIEEYLNVAEEHILLRRNELEDKIYYGK